MSVSYVTGGHSEQSSAQTGYAVTIPTGVTSGDMLLVQVQTSTTILQAPAGVTQLRSDVGGEGTFYKALTSADAGTILTWNVDIGSHGSLQWGIYRGVKDTPNASAATQGGSLMQAVCPSVTTTTTGCKIIRIALASGIGFGTASTPAGTTSRLLLGGGYYAEPMSWSDSDQAAAGDSGTATAGFSKNNSSLAITVALAPINTAPNAPTLTSPANNQTIDDTSAQTFVWDFSDPDLGDSQSAADLQWWALDVNNARVGAATTVSVSSPNQFYTFPAGYFADGKKEWQVRTYDALGTVGPWSASSFFTAATPTGVPTITAPINGSTVGTNTYDVKWSTAGGQAGYRVRRVADNAGAADATTVYWDSGQVTDANARSLSVPFETNNRYEHVQVSVTADGTLWSSWADVRVNVSYTAPAPATGSLSFDQASGSLLVTITNGTPTGSQPQNSYNDVLVDDGDGLEAKNGSTLLPLNQPYRYYLPVSGRDYSGNVVVRVYGTNGVYTDTTIN